MMIVSASTLSPSIVSVNGRFDKSTCSTFAQRLNARAETFRLLLHIDHQLIPVDSFRKPRVVFDNTGGRKQTTGHGAGDDEGRKIGTSGVDRSGEARATGADNDDFFHTKFVVTVEFRSPFGKKTVDSELQQSRAREQAVSTLDANNQARLLTTVALVREDRKRYSEPITFDAIRVWPDRTGMGGFKKFLLRGNVVDLAVAVVIGAAFGTVVTALVKDIITPIISVFGGLPDFSSWAITVRRYEVHDRRFHQRAAGLHRLGGGGLFRRGIAGAKIHGPLKTANAARTGNVRVPALFEQDPKGRSQMRILHLRPR